MGNVCLMNMTQVVLILLDNLPMANACLMNINREAFSIVRPVNLRFTFTGQSAPTGTGGICIIMLEIQTLRANSQCTSSEPSARL